MTDTEETAKKLIEFLKRNKYGRATFLPLSGISGKGGISSPQALKEPGVIGLASSLVHADDRYAGLLQYLLGKTVVATNIDAAIALARKYRHSLRIVTTDGELLSPGGSMSGGAFRNSGNLLGRRREIEELERQVKHRGDVLKEMQEQIDACRTRRNALRDEIVRQKEDLQKEYIRQNTAKMKWNEIKEKTGNVTEGYEKIRREAGEIEEQIREIKDRQDQEQEALDAGERDGAGGACPSERTGRKAGGRTKLNGRYRAAASGTCQSASGRAVHSSKYGTNQAGAGAPERGAITVYGRNCAGGAGCGRKGSADS